MVVNLFPKNLRGLIRRTWPGHRYEPVMLPLDAADTIAMAADPAEERQLIRPDEISIAASFPSEKRCREYRTGRICARVAAVRYYREQCHPQEEHELLPQNVLVENDERGRPHLRGNLPPELRAADLSISHSAAYGIALVADCLCGIDIQATKPALQRVREKFCTIDEGFQLQDSLGDLSEKQCLTLLWTAKEAAKKALSQERMPGFLELILSDLEPHATGWLLRFVVSSRQFDHYPPSVAVVAELYEGYGIAVCLIPEESGA